MDNEQIEAYIAEVVEKKIQELVHRSLTISGDNVSGGIIREFNSSGIQDKASSCQLTVSNDFTIVENKMLTSDLTVKNSLTVDGDVSFKGKISVSDWQKVEIGKFIEEKVSAQIKALNLAPIVTAQVARILADPAKSGVLQEKSLSYAYINFAGLELSGDQIKGGIVREFNSSGIQDLAQECQVTISDENTIFENVLVANEMDIKGLLKVGDELVLGEKAKAKMSDVLLEKFLVDKKDVLIKAVGDDLQTRKLDLSNLQVDGVPLVAEGMLAKSITKSNLQELGELVELKVKGESLFAESIYITKGRVGINTTKPTAALTVWDQEAEIVVKKAYKNTGFIGTERTTNLVIGANNKNNLVLGADGTVNVDDINIASIKVSVGDKEPGHKGNPGDFIFNSNPTNVPCLGWQCLGGTRWKRV